ncbi:hypothetical protein LCGC14_2789780 [marine sediment metagenome]|uniref:Tyr recombinase domain-containing protein n=1 Tax=marine sediment metagenome TaxID=412755 RepID=A0A0F8YQV6_9ZZZZ
MKIKEFLKSIEGLSVNTVKTYEQTLWQLHSTIKGDEPTTEDIYSFLVKYQASSLHRHQAAIKAYLEFTQGPNTWPFNSRQFRRKKQRILRYVSPEAIKDILDATENADHRMFVKTLFLLGCRISELMSIKIPKITSAGVHVVTKGGNEYIKVTTKDFNTELKAYAKNKKGNIFPHTYSYYDQLFKKLAKAAGHAEVTLHMLRHGRAIDLLRKGMKPTDLQQFLGHVSFNTTAIYLQIDAQDLGAELEKVEKNGQ